MSIRTVLVLALLSACQSLPSVTRRPAGECPGNLVELLTDYSERSGVSLTFDQATQAWLEDVPVEALGTLQVLRVGPVPGATSGAIRFEVLPLAHAEAGETARAIERLMRAGRSRNRQIEVLPDERTNALLVRADEEDLTNVKEIVARIDVAATGS